MAGLGGDVERLKVTGGELGILLPSLAKFTRGDVATYETGKAGPNKTATYRVIGSINAEHHVMAKLLHTAARTKTTEEVLHSLVEKYLPVGPRQETSVAYADYLGPPNSKLDADISTAEVRRALHKLNSKSAPVPDGIINRTLRNLDDHSIEYLTEVINETWKEGKVAEHVILNRLTRFPEHKELYPYTMIGFRAGLSTQDAMKLIKTSPDLSSARWEAALRNRFPAEQLWAVQQGHDAAGRLGLSVPTWERPATC
ncbi:uncharacterized protein [Dermacentor albipictus]|uniref:uncharacterized protein n=1 Tax=Dermacentor albipictus TaxID=60249 RepID=UPI0038FCB62A